MSADAAAATRPRRALNAVVGVALAAGFLWWFLHGVDLGAVMASIRAVRPGYLAAAVALSLGGFVTRSVRWRYLLAPIKWVRLSSAVSAVFAGWSVTAMLPGRLGEVARAVLLGRREDVRATAVFGTVVLERLLDAFVVVLLLGGYLALQPAGLAGSRASALLPALRTGGLLIVVVLAGVAALIVTADRLPATTRAWLRTTAERLPGPLGRLGWSALAAFGSGLSASLRRTPGRIGAARLRFWLVADTVLLWSMILGVHVCLLHAFGIDTSLLKVAPLIFLVTLGIAVPTPAALGSYEKAVQFGLMALMGAPTGTAAGYAIVAHAVTFVPSGTIGAVLLAREGLALSALVRPES
jgi:glycosyltransferase 2 family protein